MQPFTGRSALAEKIRQIYRAELGREPDQAGAEFYVGLINDGVISLEEAAADISESGEGISYDPSGLVQYRASSESAVRDTTPPRAADTSRVADDNIFETSSNAVNQGVDTVARTAGPNATEQTAGQYLIDMNLPNEQMQGAQDAYAMIDPFNDLIKAGAQGVDSARTDPAVGMAVNQLGAQSPYVGEAAETYRGSMGGAAVQRTMNQYLNPYQNQVIDNAVTRVRQGRDDALNQVRGQAAQSGAYGGARQGLVEAEVYDRAIQSENETIANLLASGFDTAAGYGQQQQGIEQRGAQGLGALGAQDLARSEALARAGLGYQSNQLAASQALAALGQTQNQTRLQQGGGLSALGTNLAGQEIARASALAQLGGQTGDRELRAGNSLVNAGQITQNMGLDALNQQLQMGNLVQQQNQNILGQGANQYDAFFNYPMSSLAAAIAGVQGNPLSGAGTTTSSTTPTMFDYLSLGAGLLSAGMR